MWMTVGIILVVVVIVAFFPRIVLCGFLILIALLERFSSNRPPIPGRGLSRVVGPAASAEQARPPSL